MSKIKICKNITIIWPNAKQITNSPTMTRYWVVIMVFLPCLQWFFTQFHPGIQEALLKATSNMLLDIFECLLPCLVHWMWPITERSHQHMVEEQDTTNSGWGDDGRNWHITAISDKGTWVVRGSDDHQKGNFSLNSCWWSFLFWHVFIVLRHTNKSGSQEYGLLSRSIGAMNTKA